MPLPTWNGQPVDEISPQMSEAVEQAWDVLRDVMGGRSLPSRSTEELLHAAEAAAWLERITATARHLVVPLAKAKGASWAELGAAMGVTRATAQHRHGQEVAEWEESLQRALRPDDGTGSSAPV